MQLDVFGIIASWLHLLATVIWIGGMSFNIWILRPSMGVLDPSQRVKLVHAVLKRFIYLAWACIAILTVTGVVIADLSSANYRTILLIKHTVVAAMTIIVAVISFILFPRFEAFLPEPSPQTANAVSTTSRELTRLLQQMVLLVKVNLTLGILILLVTSILEAV